MSMPDKLQMIVDQFAAAPRELRVQALLEYSRRVPPLADELAADRDRLEQVHECQTPFFLATEIDEEGAVHLHFDCPPEAPTVRGFAGILREGLEGEPWEDVVAVPPDFYSGMGLQEVVSTLRLRGMGAILGRLKRQIRETMQPE
jgi:cysteine desulfuration protein SufE